MDPQLAAPVNLHLGFTLGVSFIGIIFSSMLYGLTCLQTFIYLVSAPGDPWWVKTLVLSTLVIDSIHEAFLIHAGYYYSVLNFNNPAVFERVVWSLLAPIFCNAASGLLIESFIVWRVYHMSGRNIYLCVFFGLAILAHLGTNLAYPIEALRDPRFENVNKLTTTAVPGLGLSAAVDMALAATLAFYLRKGRTGWKRSDTVVNRLILYTVTTGFVPAINSILDLIFYVATPKDFFYQFFNFMVCKLYANTFLATLNARASVRTLASSSTFGSQSLATVGIEHGSARKTGRVGHGRVTVETDTLSTFQAVNVQSVQSGAESDLELKIPAGALHAGHAQSFESAGDREA